MHLEDHVGDILRKAREAAAVPLAEAAGAGGLSETSWAALEETGSIEQPPNFAALAPLLGLDEKKLLAIADGWLPQAVDLGLWRELRVITTTRDGITVNCYLVWDE